MVGSDHISTLPPHAVMVAAFCGVGLGEEVGTATDGLYEPLLLPAYTSACVRMELRFAWIPASAPFWRALPKETSTMDAKMPMMAMTTKSSMRVKPLLLITFCIDNF